MICEVYLLDVPYHIDRPFDYSAPDGASAGSVVKVPFGRANKLRLGVITKLKETTEEENIKPVHSVHSSRFSLSREMLGLCFFTYTLNYNRFSSCCTESAYVFGLNLGFNHLAKSISTADSLCILK